MRKRDIFGKNCAAAVLVCLMVGLFIDQLVIDETNVRKISIVARTNAEEKANATTAGTTSDQDAQFGFHFEYDNAVNNFTLPDWMKEFFKSQPIATHNETLADPNEKFIVLTCHKYKGTIDEACGGISDRLMHLPYYVWLAHRTGRKLLIKYSKPHPLEEFLVPPEGGLDWRLPDEYVAYEWDTYANRSWTSFRNERRIVWHRQIEKSPWNETRFIFANTNLAKIPPLAGSSGGLRSVDVWPGIFRRMFKPSKGVGKAIETIAKESGLVPGEYGGAHIRARFSVGRGGIKMRSKKNENAGVNMGDNETQQMVKRLGDTAVKCVTKVMPETKHIYVATDTNELIQYLLNENPSPKLRWNDEDAGGENVGENVTIVVRPDYNASSLHIESRNFAGLEGTAPPEAFFQIFIDLWMMAHTKCLSQGLGGFGHFGSMLSGNHLTCRTRHRDYILGILDSCPTPSELKMKKLMVEVEDLKAKAIEAKKEADARIEEKKKAIDELLKVHQEELNSAQEEKKKAEEEMLKAQAELKKIGDEGATTTATNGTSMLLVKNSTEILDEEGATTATMLVKNLTEKRT